MSELRAAREWFLGLSETNRDLIIVTAAHVAIWALVFALGVWLETAVMVAIPGTWFALWYFRGRWRNL